MAALSAYGGFITIDGECKRNTLVFSLMCVCVLWMLHVCVCVGM
jgi:hypothetical protein